MTVEMFNEEQTLSQLECWVRRQVSHKDITQKKKENCNITSFPLQIFREWFYAIIMQNHIRDKIDETAEIDQYHRFVNLIQKKNVVLWNTNEWCCIQNDVKLQFTFYCVHKPEQGPEMWCYSFLKTLSSSFDEKHWHHVRLVFLLDAVLPFFE